MPHIPSRWNVLLLGLLALSAGAGRSVAADSPGRFALRGEILTPAEVIGDGYVCISGGKVESVGAKAPDATVRVIETGGIICPGLIDLHNHLTWNVFPRWNAGMKFPNRYEWQLLPAYLAALANPHEAMIKRGLGLEMTRYGEVKAMAGGATSLTGLYGADFGPGFRPPYPGMMRLLDLNSRFYPDGTPEPVSYHVYPLVLSEHDAAEIRDGLKNGRLKSLLIHLAEGSPRDASSMMEYRILKARGLLLPGVTLIHGVALHREQFEEMARLGVGLVWSPRSNFELYGATADVAAAKRAGVRIALAPDWSPTGSDGMLQELSYAARWNASQPAPVFSDSELVRMATTEPARLAAVDDRIGSLAAGLLADVLVVRKGEGDACHVLVHSGPADVEMVMVEGHALYGRKQLVETIDPSQAWTSLVVAKVPRELAVSADPRLGDWRALTHRLEDAMAGLGTHLGPISTE